MRYIATTNLATVVRPCLSLPLGHLPALWGFLVIFICYSLFLEIGAPDSDVMMSAGSSTTHCTHSETFAEPGNICVNIFYQRKAKRCEQQQHKRRAGMGSGRDRLPIERNTTRKDQHPLPASGRGNGTALQRVFGPRNTKNGTMEVGYLQGIHL